MIPYDQAEFQAFLDSQNNMLSSPNLTQTEYDLVGANIAYAMLNVTSGVDFLRLIPLALEASVVSFPEAYDANTHFSYLDQLEQGILPQALFSWVSLLACRNDTNVCDRTPQFMPQFGYIYGIIDLPDGA
ncbi:MAG: hypothetical protein R2827_08720 [Bdellovibrionales bacterium]